MYSSRSWKQKFLRVAVSSFLILLLGVTCFGQQPSPGGPDGPPQSGLGQSGPGQPGPGHSGRRGMGGPGGPGGGLRLGPPGRWWDDPEFIKKLGLSDDQQKKMDDIFNTSRLKLIDQFAAVQKEEAIMEPLVAADPGPSQIGSNCTEPSYSSMRGSGSQSRSSKPRLMYPPLSKDGPS